MNNFFLELTLILVIASILSIIFRFLKLPSILAYILAGILIGPVGLLAIGSHDVIEGMAQIGIALLLFILGLELRLSDLKSVGKISAIIGLGQILITFSIGFLAAFLLGFSMLASVYMAIALTFSSTIIIVKLLSDKRDLNSLYGKLSIGLLLVQDFFAIIALVILSSFGGEGGAQISPLGVMAVLGKAVLLFGVVVFLSKSILPSIINKIARSSELLFLFSIAWAFGIAALVSSPLIGFSIEIGGFLAGLALANSSESLHISSRTKSLRDFFIVIFFVTLGMSMVVTGVNEIILPAVALSIFVLLLKPLIVMGIMGVLGYRKRTSFLTALTVTQISEFSLIVVFLGFRLGHFEEKVVSLATLVGVITFAASAYLIMNGNFLYKRLSKMLKLFEKKNAKSEKSIDIGELSDHIVLAGVNRAGKSILNAITSEDNNLLVVDFNPDVVKKLSEINIKVIFGDIADVDIIENAQIEKAKAVISTVSDLEDNLHLIKSIKAAGGRVKTIVIARERADATILYMAGADLVVVPHETSGAHIAKIIKDGKIDEIDNLRQKDLKDLGIEK